MHREREPAPSRFGRYDAWQLANELQTDWGTKPEQEAGTPRAPSHSPPHSHPSHKPPHGPTVHAHRETHRHVHASCIFASAVRQYGVDFLSQLTALQANPKNGGFITSCICHGCPWADLTPSTGSKVTTYDYYIKWANDPKWPSSSEPVTIDARGPNGGGDITFSECSPFPPSPPLVEA